VTHLKKFFAFCAAAAVLVHTASVWAATAAAPSEKGMTLWQLIKAGGGSMILLGILSIACVAFIAYFAMYYRESRLCPEHFTRDVLDKLSSKKYTHARELALEHDNIVAHVVSATLDRQDRSAAEVKEAGEATAKAEITKLWEGLSFLSDIAVIAPLVGLLGTVLGMIDSFNVIALQSSAAKPVLLAAGIAKAMVATAGGLMIAIPASTAYSFFRARVFKITARVEAVTSQVTAIVAGDKGKGAYVQN